MSERENLPTSVEALADLYRRSDGTMRQCNYNSTSRCLQRGCHRDGCDRANEILKSVKEVCHAAEGSDDG